MRRAFSSSDARQIVEVSQRCLEYWDQRGIVRPSINLGVGKGSERQYSFADLTKLAVVRRLRHFGLSLQKIRKGLALLRQRSPSKDPLLALGLTTDGSTLCRLTWDRKIVEDVLARGQFVFSVIAVGEIEQQLHDGVLRFDEELRKRTRGRPLKRVDKRRKRGRA